MPLPFSWITPRPVMMQLASSVSRANCAMLPAQKILVSGSFQISQYLMWAWLCSVAASLTWVAIAVIHAFQMALVPLPSLFRSMGASHSPLPPPRAGGVIAGSIVGIGGRPGRSARECVHAFHRAFGEYARARSESRLVKSNTPEAVLMIGPLGRRRIPEALHAIAHRSASRRRLCSCLENPKKLGRWGGSIDGCAVDGQSERLGGGLLRRRRIRHLTVKLNCPVCSGSSGERSRRLHGDSRGQLSRKRESSCKGAVPPRRSDVFEYEVPAVAFDKDVVVRLTGGGATDSVNDLDAVSFGDEESETCAVKVNCPA